MHTAVGTLPVGNTAPPPPSTAATAATAAPAPAVQAADASSAKESIKVPIQDGDSKAAAAAKASREAARLNQLRTLAVMEQSQLLVVEEKKSELKKAREDHKAIVTEMTKFILSETLPIAPQALQPVDEIEKDPAQFKLFKQNAAAADTPATTTAKAADISKTGPGDAEAKAHQDEFDASSLGQIGIKDSLKDKLEADGVRNGLTLRKWINEHPRRKIAGVGEGAIEKINGMMADWFIAKQTPVKQPKLAHGRNSLVKADDAGKKDEPLSTQPAADGQLPVSADPKRQAERDVKSSAGKAAKSSSADKGAQAERHRMVLAKQVEDSLKKCKLDNTPETRERLMAHITCSDDPDDAVRSADINQLIDWDNDLRTLSVAAVREIVTKD